MDRVVVSLIEGYGEDCEKDGRRESRTRIFENKEAVLLTVVFAVFSISLAVFCLSLYLQRKGRTISDQKISQEVNII